MASVRRALVKITVFDFTCAEIRHAKRNASHSSAVGLRLVHLRFANLAVTRVVGLDDAIAFLQEHPAQYRPQFQVATFHRVERSA